jgi:hypothetical protein
MGQSAGWRWRVAQLAELLAIGLAASSLAGKQHQQQEQQQEQVLGSEWRLCLWQMQTVPLHLSQAALPLANGKQPLAAGE